MAASTLTTGHGPVEASARRSGPAFTVAAGLSARQRLYEMQVPPVDLPGAVSSELPVDVTSVLDVGCGNGAFLRRLRRDRPEARVIGVDISHDMLADARALAGLGPLVAADAESLPLRERSVDAAIAMHVLYLLADPIAALASLFRVVRPGGKVMVGTSDRDDKQAVRRLLEESTAGLDPAAGREVTKLHDRFDLAAAVTVMRALTPELRVLHFRSELRLTTAQPLVDYVASLGCYCPDGVSSEAWQDVVRRVDQRVRAELRASGRLTIATHVGIVIGCVPSNRPGAAEAVA